MKILVAGLGLIGGSMAKALKRAGMLADGFDRKQVVEKATAQGAVRQEAKRFSDYDIVFVALPPQAAMRFMDENVFQDGAVVADICGIKSVVEHFILSKPRNFHYVGCHPMAGKEVSGFENSCETLFDGASMIITENAFTDRHSVTLLEDIYKRMGFGLIRHCSAEYHDRKIAYTSQLAHIVSNAYVKSDTANGYTGFTGGSFQDMTRIAGVDEKVWTQLYFMNRENISSELDRLIANLQEYSRALAQGDEDRFSELLKEGRRRKEELDREE